MTESLKLYELANARDILDSFLLESEGEVTPELLQLLDELDGQVAEKIERVGLYIQEQMQTAKAIKAEAERLTARSRAREKAAEGLKAYLMTQMIRLDKTKVIGLLCTVARQKNSVTSIESAITPEQLYATRPDLATRQEVVTYSLNREAILAAHDSNTTLPSDLRVERGEHVRIR